MDDDRGFPVIQRKPVPATNRYQTIPAEGQLPHSLVRDAARPGSGTDSTETTIPRKPLQTKSNYSALPDLDEHASLSMDPGLNLDAGTLVAQDDVAISEIEPPEKTLQTPNDNLGMATGSRQLRNKWHISWISQTTLLAFAVIFLLLITVVIMLTQLSHANNGFPLSPSTNPYTWKYGPTAILTLVVALWAQVDIAVRREAPWAEMSNGYTTGGRGLLLDYVSPILPSALWKALRYRHWRVVTTMAIFGLLKLAIFFSTGLLVPHQVSVTTAALSIPLKLLGGAHADPDYPDSSNQDHSSYFTDELYDETSHNITFPPGATLEAAFQEISNIDEFPVESVVTAQVFAFFPNLECIEIAINVSYGSTFEVDISTGEVHHARMELSFQSPGCGGPLSVVQPACSILSWMDCYFTSTYFTSSTAVNCPAFGEDSEYPDEYNGFVFVLMKVAKDPGSLDTGESKVLWKTGILCETKYALETADLNVNTQYPFFPGGKTLSAPTSHTEKQIRGYAYSNLTFDFSSHCQFFDQGDAFIKTVPARYSDVDYSNLDPIFQLMLTVTSDFDVEQLRNASALAESTTKVFKALCAQFVATWLSFPDHLLTNGSYVSPGQRLFVQSSATWEMCAVLGAATVGALMLIALHRRHPQHPKSLLELAASAQKDPVLVELLITMGHTSNKQLSCCSKLSVKYSYVSTNQHRLQAENDQQLIDGHRQAGQSSYRHNINWWIPMSGRRWFTLLCVLIPSAEIALLEVLQRKSDAHNGIWDTHRSFGAVHSLVSLVPAGLMLITAALYSSVAFSIGVLSPYHLMKKKFPRVKTVNQNPAGDLPVLALFKCLARGYYAVVLMIAATTFGSLLTIIVSGLYAVNEVSRTEETTVVTTDQFDLSWNQLQDSTSLTATLIPSVQEYGMNYPSGIFETFAYPTLQLDHDDDNVARVLRSGNTTTIDTTLFVTRGSLDCSLVLQSELYYGPGIVPDFYCEGGICVPHSSGPGQALIATRPLPKQCQLSAGTWKESIDLEAIANYSVHGDIDQISALPVWAIPLSGKGNSSNYPPDCPSIAFTIGNFRDGNDTSDKTVYVCTQVQEELPALLRFNVPSLTLDTSFPPQLDESQVQRVSAYQYYDPIRQFTTSTFYTGWVKQLTGLSLDDMYGPSNANKFLNATQHTYRMLMAFTFGDAMRLTTSELNSTNTIPTAMQIGTSYKAEIENRNVVRVSQNKTSKVILQALLGAMLSCFLVAYPLVDTRSTLPHNPCSLAGTLSLLLGGTLSQEMKRMEDEGVSQKAIEEILADKRVRLGWWESPGGGPARFGVHLFDDDAAKG